MTKAPARAGAFVVEPKREISVRARLRRVLLDLASYALNAAPQH